MENDDIVANGPGDIVLLQGENSKLTIGDGTVAVSDDTQATLSGVDDSVTLGNRDNDTLMAVTLSLTSLDSSPLLSLTVIVR